MMTVLVLFRLLLRRTWIAIAVIIPLATPLNAIGTSRVELLLGVAVVLFTTGLLLRVGVLAYVTMGIVFGLVTSLPLTLIRMRGTSVGHGCSAGDYRDGHARFSHGALGSPGVRCIAQWLASGGRVKFRVDPKHTNEAREVRDPSHQRRQWHKDSTLPAAVCTCRRDALHNYLSRPARMAPSRPI